MKQDLKRLDNLSNAYHKTSGEIQEMWKKKWYEMVKIVAKKIKLEQQLEEIAERNGF
tara:strand:- start:207 stop:377 length:171 start_codon:yes stop_codon:yes gene_type:complete